MIIDVEKYNFIREALAKNPNEEHEIITVNPRSFALKKEPTDNAMAAALEILHDPNIKKGIHPYSTVTSFFPDDPNPSPELALYILVCYAIAVQQEWIVYSTIMNRYYVNKKDADIVQYVEDFHQIKLD